MAIDSALGRLGIKQGVCTSSTRPTNPFEGQVIYESDTNRTLVYDNAAWVVVADNQVLSIDAANGNVGIGTTSPSEKLHVDGNVTVSTGNSANAYEGGSNYWRPQDVNGNSYFDINSGGFYVDSATYHLRNASGVSRLEIDSSGNVGIGTTSPSTKADIYTDAAAGVPYPLTLSAKNASGAKKDYVQIGYGIEQGAAGIESGGFRIQTLQSGSVADALSFTGHATAQKWDFYTQGTSRMTVNSTGNVGVNTTSPTGRIHLYSNTAGNGQDENYLKIDRANTSTESAVNWATAGTNKWFLGTDNTGNDDIILYDWAGGKTAIYGDSSTGIISFPQQPAFTARITTTGTRYNSQLLPFSSASLNLGNHYSTSTYLFTAPISGHYFFSYSVLIRNNSGTARTETGFWKNGGWLMNRGNSYVNSTGGSSDHVQASSSVITYMNANDTMGIYQLQTSPSDTYGGTSLSIFTGQLVG